MRVISKCSLRVQVSAVGRAHPARCPTGCSRDSIIGHSSQKEKQETKAPSQANVDDTDAARTEERSLAEQLGQFGADAAVNPLTYGVGIAISLFVVKVLGERDYIIFALAALPVVGLTALSKSPIGAQVVKSLEAKLPDLEQDAQQMRAEWEQAKAQSPFYGEERPKLPGPLGNAPHLTGDMPGDYGFDPLGLWVVNEDWQNWIAEAELLHGRWAMLAVVGVLIPEILSLCGADVGEPVWWKVGGAKLQDGLSINYAGIEGFRVAGGQGLLVIAACQVALMGGPEYARYVGINSLQPVGVFLPGNQIYPGGVPFDPLKYSMSADDFVNQQVKEMKNGRLAMVTMLAFAAQAIVTREGPVANLLTVLDRNP